MARKATVKKVSKEETVKEKKPRGRKPKRVVDYDEFTKTVLYEIIKNEIPEIKRICESVEEVELITDEDWLYLNKLCIKVSEAMKCVDYIPYFRYDIFEIRKRVKCGLTEKVCESQTRRFILDFIDLLSDDDERNIHLCKQIYTHIALWIDSETRRTIEKKKKED